MSCEERTEDVWLLWLEKRRQQVGWWQCPLCCGMERQLSLPSPWAQMQQGDVTKQVATSYPNTGAGYWGKSWTPSSWWKGRGEKCPSGIGVVKLTQPWGMWVPPALAGPPQPPEAMSHPSISSAQSTEIRLATRIGAEGVWSLARIRPVFVTARKTSRRETREDNRGNINFIYFFISVFLK